MATYGLSPRRREQSMRSLILLAGLFLLVYVIVYAGGLIFEVLSNGDATVPCT